LIPSRFFVFIKHVLGNVNDEVAHSFIPCQTLEILILPLPAIWMETFEKWLRRVSKIFSAKRTTRRHRDSGQAENVLSGKAENI